MHEVPGLDPDPRQQAAIEHVHGPLLVVAGAGTGKTTVLTQRIVRLIREGHARPDEILALTYTNNAARLMCERVQAELQNPAGKLQTLTFHAYCDHLLERTGHKFGVLDEKDLWVYLRRRLHELPRTHFVRAANVGQFLGDLLDFIRRCHDELVTPEGYARYVEKLERGEIPVPRTAKSKKAAALTREETIARCREIRDVFVTVERMLREENLGTFAHMITGAYELFKGNPELLARERQRARFILVDEFQDANFAQIKILQQLGGEEPNVFAVGDPDQAVYRFRGASSAAFELFRRDFPNSATVALDRNRRSTTPILKCAFAVIAKNPDVFAHGAGPRLPRQPLVSAREEIAKQQGREFPSAAVQAVVLEGKAVESTEVVTAIVQQQRQTRCPWNDFAVLYRTHSHRDQIALELAERGIPFSIEAMDVLDTPEVRDLLACVGAVVSTSNDADLFRVSALPQFSVDANQLRAGIRTLPKDATQGSLASVLAQIPGGVVVLETARQTEEELARQEAKGRTALEIIVRRFALERASPALQAVLDFAGEWEKKPITHTGEVSEFLEYLDHFREAGGWISLPTKEEENAVRLLTAHSAKGLEFKNVFIIRATSPSFPAAYREPLIEFPKRLRDQDSLAPDDDKTLNEQEERRLFYVAMTRACDSLSIYACKGRGKKDDTPPGFLRDLLKDSKLGPFLHKQEARGFQTDLFAQASPAPPTCRIAEWVNLPPAYDWQVLSATAVERYNICPLQFKLEREWRIPGEVGAAVQYGAAMHRVLRAYHDSVRFGRPLTADALVELFRDDLEQAGMQDKYQKGLYEKQGMAQLHDFLETAGPESTPEILHLEEQFKVKIGDTAVVGRIDRIDRVGDQRVAITDYKTGRPKLQEDADRSLQLSIYALAARQQWGYETESLIFYNLEGNVPVVTRRSELQLHEARCEVEKVAANIAAGKFDPKTGQHCNFCAYRSLCPATEKRIALTLPTNSGKKKKQSASR